MRSFLYPLSYLLFFVLSVVRLSAEGTKQIAVDSTEVSIVIMPANAGTGNTGPGHWEPFAHYTSDDSSSLYIAIKDPSVEVINLGFGDILKDWSGAGVFDSTVSRVWYRVWDPTRTIIIASDTVPTTGIGYITNKSQLNAGPLPTTGGYAPIQVFPIAGIAGNYIIEFNITDKVIPDPAGTEPVFMRYFDMTVTNNGRPQDGRLWAYQWNILTLSLTPPYWDPIRSTFYIYTTDSVVTSMHMNNMTPRQATVFANSTGCFDTGNYFEDIKSYNGYAGYREHKIFVNNPDLDIFPSYTVPTTATTPSASGCSVTGYCLELTVSKDAFAFIYVDINFNGVYDSGLDVRLDQRVEGGYNCINWDGRDALGNLITFVDTIRFIVQVANGLTNYPMQDVEGNPYGLKPYLVRPGVPKFLGSYWDNSNVGVGTPLSNLTTPCVLDTCNNWLIYDGNDKTINTFWYNVLHEQSVVHLIPDGNCPPILRDDTAVTVVNTPITTTIQSWVSPNPPTLNGGLIDNDEPDPDGNPLLPPTLVSGPSHGSVIINANGTYTYTPDLNYVGNDFFVYQVCDNPNSPILQQCNLATAYIQVLGPQIGVALQAGIPAFVSGCTWDIPFTITLENLDTFLANNVQVYHDLSQGLPVGASVVSVVNMPSSSSPLFDFNTLFNGTSNTKILTSNAGTAPLAANGDNTLPVSLGTTYTIQYRVRVDLNTTGPNPYYYNQVTATTSSAQGGSPSSTDLSQVGANPDPNGNGNPGDVNESTPSTTDVNRPDRYLVIVDDTICRGAGATLNLLLSEVGIAYQLIDPLGNSILASQIGNGGTLTFNIPSPAMLGDYSILASGSCSVLLQDIGKVSTLPQVANLNDIYACDGGTTEIEIPLGAGVTYNFYNAAGMLIQGPSLDNTYAPIVAAGTSETYLVSVNQGACESNRDTVSVTVFQTNQTPLIPNIIICPGDTQKIEIPFVSSATLYKFYESDSTTLILSSPGVRTWYITPPIAPGSNRDYVIQIETGWCPNNYHKVNVSVPNALSAGSDNTVNICYGSSAIDLFSSLGGTPNAGGTWINLNNAGTISGNILNLSNPATGTFQYGYAVPSAGGCLADTAIVSVIKNCVPPFISSANSNSNNAGTITGLSTPENTPLTICLDIIDADGINIDVLTSQIQASHGVILNTPDPDDTCFIYVPNNGFFGVDTLSPVITCDSSGLCDTAQIIVQVQYVNNPPVPTLDTVYVTIQEGDTAIVCIQGTDVDGDPIDLTSVSNNASSGTISGLNDGDTCVTYIPNINFTGQDTFEVSLCDNGSPLLCEPVVVIVTVNPVNSAPIANDDLYSVNPGSTIAIPVLINDIDPDGDSLALSLCSNPNYGTVSLFGSYVIYTANLGAPNTIDSVCYVICDPYGLCDTGMIYIILPAQDLPPIATNDVVTTPEDQAIIIDVLSNDYDPNFDEINTTAVTSGPIHGTVVINPNGSITYTPDSNYFGQDSFIYVVCDTTAIPVGPLCDTAIVVITITPVNDAPVITDGSGNNLDSLWISLPQDTDIEICLDLVDIDGDLVDISQLIWGPFNGLLTGLNNGDSCITYTPNVGYVGLDSLLVVACDNGAPTLCDTIVIYIQVTPTVLPNNCPIALDDIIATTDSTGIIIHVQANDFDAEGNDLTTSILWGPNHGSASVINGDSISYTSNLGYCGTDTIAYMVCDNGNPICCDTAYVYILVSPLDTDQDGIPNYYEGLTLDSDGDGHLNYMDLDSDNDAIPDSVEALGDVTNLCQVVISDFDGDGVDDYLDLDTDNDGIVDIIEGGNIDANQDGVVDVWVDNNNDGLTDQYAVPFPPSADIDLLPDWRDLDSDNDGITDLEEAGGVDANSDGLVDSFNDLDGDGWDDDHQSSTPKDFDSDGVSDYQDLDSDNDGITDATEANQPDINGDGVLDNFTDTNLDGLDDTHHTGTPVDTDGDGFEDYNDLDSDNDGIKDIIEAGVGTVDINQNGMIDSFNDADGDGKDDNEIIAIPEDTDADLVGDWRDLDSDGDGVLDENEADEDGDGILDDCDGDGIPDFRDLDQCLLEIPEAFSPNSDGTNDFFVIKGLYRYPHNTLTIFNRWGNKVYLASPYQNNWDGKNTSEFSTGDGYVPDGTYFYVLELGDGSKGVEGYVYIKR